MNARTRMLRGALTLLGLLWAAETRAEVRVEISLDPEAVQMGETTVLSVQVDGATSLDQGPSLPDIPGLLAQSAGTSTSISITNGHMTRSVSYQFMLMPQRAGQFTIGPVEVREGGKVYRSGTALLTVAGAGAPPASPGRGRPPLGVPPPPAEEPAAGESDLAFARASVDKDHVYLGEQVTLRFRIYVRSDVPVLQSQLESMPATEGFWREELPPNRNSTVLIQGRSYQVTEIASALFPTQSGSLQIGSGAVQLVIQDLSRAPRVRDPFGFFGNAFAQRQLRLESKPVTVRVDPLPEPKPADFSGGVGDYHVEASLERPETGQNVPLTLTLTVDGTGNVSTVGDPRIPDLPGVRSYSSGSEAKTRRDGDILGGTKSFRLVLVPENTGRHEIPPLRFSVFDPQRRRYVSLSTPSLSYNVTPGTGGDAGVGGEVALTGRDLRTLRENTQLARRGSGVPWKHARFWVIQALPLALVAGAWGWRMRRARIESNWGFYLSRGAPGRLQRELDALRKESAVDLERAYDRLDAALERYFTDRFRLPVRGLTRDALVDALARDAVPPAGIEEARRLLDACDFARFAPSTRSAEELGRMIEQARRLPQALEGRAAPSREGAKSTVISLILILGASACLGFGSRIVRGADGLDLSTTAPGSVRPLTAAEAQQAFSRGNEAYRRGEYAGAMKEYESVIDGGFESADLCLNLGDAAWRAGEPGWAVYWFERGHRMAPRDPDLQANLRLALLASKDQIPEESTNRFLSGLSNLQNRSSLPGALRGLSLFWWLFALWLAARIAFGGERRRGGRNGTPRAFGLAGAALGLCLGLSAAWALIMAGQAAGAPNAVVVSDELPVRSNPEPEATTEFTLHAGTRVRLGRDAHGFREVLFSEKLRGWGAADGLADLSD